MNNSIYYARHSTRKFLDKKVDEVLIKEIIADAQCAPSWCNSQPWKAYVVTGEAAKKMTKSHNDNNVNGTRAWCDIIPPQFGDDDWTPAEWKNMRAFWSAFDVGIDGNFGDKYDMIKDSAWAFHAPAIIYITIPKKSTMYQAYDAGAFGYGITLAAHERGLSSIPAHEFIRFPEEIRAVFDIPEEEAIFMGIGIGYPDEEAGINNVYKPNEKVRASLEEILEIVSE